MNLYGSVYSRAVRAVMYDAHFDRSVLTNSLSMAARDAVANHSPSLRCASGSVTISTCPRRAWSSKTLWTSQRCLSADMQVVLRVSQNSECSSPFLLSQHMPCCLLAEHKGRAPLLVGLQPRTRVKLPKQGPRTPLPRRRVTAHQCSIQGRCPVGPTPLILSQPKPHGISGLVNRLHAEGSSGSVPVARVQSTANSPLSCSCLLPIPFSVEFARAKCRAQTTSIEVWSRVKPKFTQSGVHMTEPLELCIFSGDPPPFLPLRWRWSPLQFVGVQVLW